RRVAEVADSAQTSAVENCDEREQPDLGTVLVLVRVAADQAVRLVVADHPVPLADPRLDVLEDLVVRVLEAQEVGAPGRPSDAQRTGAGLVDIGARTELVV